MIPLKDTIPSRTFPAVNITLVVINCLVFLYELALGPGLSPFIERYGIVPVRFFNAGMISDMIAPLFSFMFLHGGWLHVISNMLYLWIFGDNVEDRMGHFRYLVFYLMCGVASGLVQLFVAPASRIPIVGASGAIAGVMGAYLLLYPFGRVVTLVFFFIFIDVVQIPAFFFLVFWFVLQFFSGAFATPGQEGGVAWWAHVGGFLCGLLMVFPLARRKRPARWVIRKRHPW
ncbi:MAG: Rhomboid family protein [Deltaproteobacteria bacterium]|jgi:membrane associated rhomboid family serine protease|nr:Rhomboid family protein [Deltaproteobacteria bacterium]